MRRHCHKGWWLTAVLFLFNGPAAVAQEIDEDAIEDAEEGVEVVPIQKLDVVQNKSFNKEGRLELFPHVFAIVTNNHFANRDLYFTGATVAWHAREQLYFELTGQFYPYTTGDNKGLTNALLTLNGGSEGAPPVEVPAEKLYVGASLGVSPVYGKINLAGEHVQNFDVSFLVGAGLLQVETHSYRVGGYDENGQVIPQELQTSPEKKTYPVGSLGLTGRFPLADWFTLKADARLLGYVQKVPDYLADPVTVDGEVQYPEKAAFTTAFIVTTGGSFFLPRGR